MSPETRSKRFNNLRLHKPKPGDVLKSKSGRAVPIFVEIKPDRGNGKMQVMFTHALIDHEATGWYLSAETTGLTVLILPRSQELLMERSGNRVDNLTVDEVRVVRHNKTSTALICELLDESLEILDDPDYIDFDWE